MARTRIIVWLTLSIILQTLPSAAQSFAPVADATTMTRTADEALEQGRFQDGLRLYSAALKAAPNSSEALLGRAMANEMLDRTHIAIQDYRSAIRADPKNYVAIESLALLFEGSGTHMDEVPDLYRQALKLDPRPEWRENLRVWLAMHLSRQRPPESYAIGYWHAGNSAAKKNDFGKAVELYSRAIDKDPNMFHAYFSRGMIRLRDGEAALAVADFDAVLRLSPAFPRCLIRRGSANEQLGRFDAAHEDYRRAVETIPSDPEGHYFLGKSFQKRGQLEQALESYKTAMGLKPKSDLRELLSTGIGEISDAVARRKVSNPPDKTLW
jgi:tetratricopeptide (TPR) repeat protein